MILLIANFTFGILCKVKVQVYYTFYRYNIQKLDEKLPILISQRFCNRIKEQETDRARDGNDKNPVLKLQCTLRASAIATPTMKRKKGITKSASVQPFHGEWSMRGYAPPASSTNIITCAHISTRVSTKNTHLFLFLSFYKHIAICMCTLPQ